MFNLDRLKNLASSSTSGVTSIKQVVHLALAPTDLHDLNTSILKNLNVYLFEYYPDVGGVLMGYESLKMRKKTGEILADQPYVHIDIQGIFYLFRPTVGDNLLAIVNKKSSGHVGCLVHDTFNVSMLMSSGVTQLEVGQSAIISVSSVSHIRGRVNILAKLVEVTTEGNVTSARLIEEVSDFESEELDSGIENNIDRMKTMKVKMSASVSEPIVEQKKIGQKREAEDEIIDEKMERKRRRKAEKKAKKMELKSQELEGDSSDDFQSVKKSFNESSANETSLGNLELSSIAQKSPKIKTSSNSSQMSPKTPQIVKGVSQLKTPKSSKKEQFDLPAGFTVKEYKTEKSQWKTYIGPDGKSHRSLADVKKHLDNVVSITCNLDNLEKVIESIATDWTPDNLNKEDRANPDIVKEFPKKSDEFFVLEDMHEKVKKSQQPKSKNNTTNEISTEDTLLNSTNNIVNVSKMSKSENQDTKTDGEFNQSSLVTSDTNIGSTKKLKKKKKKKKKELESLERGNSS